VDLQALCSAYLHRVTARMDSPILIGLNIAASTHCYDEWEANAAPQWPTNITNITIHHGVWLINGVIVV